MRVLHFAEIFSPLTETFIYDYVVGLERRGVENHVATLRRTCHQARPFDRVRELPGMVRYHPVRLARRALAELGFGHSSEAAWPAIRQQFRKAVREIRPDVVHAHFGRAAGMVAAAATSENVPLVVTFYGYDISRYARDDRWVERYRSMWPTISAVTVLSDHMRRRAIQLGCPSEKVHVVRLSRHINDALFRWPERPVRNFVSVGRLVSKKGHLDAIDAIRAARAKTGQDIRLDIIGDGPLRATLEEHIQSAGLSGSVRLLGPLENCETLNRMRMADAFILCSKTDERGEEEGTPTVLVEAQLIGLPCVTTRHAGIEEMLPAINHRYTAAEGDVQAIAECIVAMCRCTRSELVDIANAGRDKVLTEFQLSDQCGKLQRLYETSTLHTQRHETR